MTDTPIKIRYVTGWRHLTLFDRLEGIMDARSHQICKDGDCYMTPRIIQKVNSEDEFCNKLYLMAAQEMKKVYVDLSRKSEELNVLLEPEEDGGQFDMATEEGRRRANARCAANEARKRKIESIRITLAEYLGRINTLDEALNENLKKAGSVLRAHIGAYWSGILRGSKRDDLPVFPLDDALEHSGQSTYEEHRSRNVALIGKMLEMAKGDAAYEKE